MNQNTAAEVTEWLEQPEIKAGYDAIAKLVVAATDCCTMLSGKGTKNAKDGIRMILAKTEVQKERIAEIALSELSTAEKREKTEKLCGETFSYFEDIMAQE